MFVSHSLPLFGASGMKSQMNQVTQRYKLLICVTQFSRTAITQQEKLNKQTKKPNSKREISGKPEKTKAARRWHGHASKNIKSSRALPTLQLV